jgi:hypothetical protein
MSLMILLDHQAHFLSGLFAFPQEKMITAVILGCGTVILGCGTVTLDQRVQASV